MDGSLISDIIRLLRVDSKVEDSLKKCKSNCEAWQLLTNYEKDLDKEISELNSSAVDAEKLLDELHRYNDMKDMTQAVIGSLATIEGVTSAKIHQQYELPIDS